MYWPAGQLTGHQCGPSPSNDEEHAATARTACATKRGGGIAGRFVVRTIGTTYCLSTRSHRAPFRNHPWALSAEPPTNPTPLADPSNCSPPNLHSTRWHLRSTRSSTKHPLDQRTPSSSSIRMAPTLAPWSGSYRPSSTSTHSPIANKRSSSSSSSSEDSGGRGGGVPLGTILGITIPIVVVLVLVGGLVATIFRRRKAEREQQAQLEADPDAQRQEWNERASMMWENSSRGMLRHKAQELMTHTHNPSTSNLPQHPSTSLMMAREGRSLVHSLSSSSSSSPLALMPTDRSSRMTGASTVVRTPIAQFGSMPTSPLVGDDQDSEADALPTYKQSQRVSRRTNLLPTYTRCSTFSLATPMDPSRSRRSGAPTIQLNPPLPSSPPPTIPRSPLSNSCRWSSDEVPTRSSTVGQQDDNDQGMPVDHLNTLRSYPFKTTATTTTPTDRSTEENTRMQNQDSTEHLIGPASVRHEP